MKYQVKHNGQTIEVEGVHPYMVDHGQNDGRWMLIQPSELMPYYNDLKYLFGHGYGKALVKGMIGNSLMFSPLFQKGMNETFHGISSVLCFIEDEGEIARLRGMIESIQYGWDEWYADMIRYILMSLSILVSKEEVDKIFSINREQAPQYFANFWNNIECGIIVHIYGEVEGKKKFQEFLSGTLVWKEFYSKAQFLGMTVIKQRVNKRKKGV